MNFSCPNCSRKLNAPAGCEGRRTKCPSCQRPVTVPKKSWAVAFFWCFTVALTLGFVAGRLSVQSPASAAAWQYEFEKQQQKIKEDNIPTVQGPAKSIHLTAEGIVKK
jgi:hypothetical protein